MKITLFSKKPILSGANYLCKGLREFGEVTFCCMSSDDEYGYNTEPFTTDTQEIKEAINGCDMLILSSSVTLDWIFDNYDNCAEPFRNKTTKIVIGDSNYCRTAKGYNQVFKNYGIDVHIMPDIAHYCTIPHKIYYPPCEKLDNKVPYSTNPFVISHLPGIKYDSGIKGTVKIEEIVGGINGIELISQGVTPWKEAIEIKKHSTLYIDQMINDDRFGVTYKGGLGKNGIEAMMLGIPVITSTQSITDVSYPMAQMREDNLREVIEVLRDMGEFLEHFRKEQQQWALNNCTPIAVARKIMEA
jgi:hypothetical protein